MKKILLFALSLAVTAGLHSVAFCEDAGSKPAEMMDAGGGGGAPSSEMGGSAVSDAEAMSQEGEKVTISGRVKLLEPDAGIAVITDAGGVDTEIKMKRGTANKLSEGDIVSITYKKTPDANIATRVTKTRAGSNGGPGETREMRTHTGIEGQDAPAEGQPPAGEADQAPPAEGQQPPPEAQPAQ